MNYYKNNIIRLNCGWSLLLWCMFIIFKYLGLLFNKYKEENELSFDLVMVNVIYIFVL